MNLPGFTPCSESAFSDTTQFFVIIFNGWCREDINYSGLLQLQYKAAVIGIPLALQYRFNTV